MATHSRILAWKIPWMEEPGRLQSMELQRVGHEWATSLLRFICFFAFGSNSEHLLPFPFKEYLIGWLEAFWFFSSFTVDNFLNCKLLPLCYMRMNLKMQSNKISSRKKQSLKRVIFPNQLIRFAKKNILICILNFGWTPWRSYRCLQVQIS